ncbi:MAG: type II secretion system F family protein [Vicinamibacterales bacterium]
MALALLTFGMTLAVMLGLYWAFVVRPESERSRALARRVEGIDPTTPTDTRVAVPVTTTSMIDALLSSNLTIAARLQGYLTEAGLPWSASGLASRMLAGAVAAGALGVLMTGRLAGVAAAVVGAAVPYLYAARLRAVRLTAFEEQFPEAIDLIARSLRAGHTFTTGLGIAADEIPPPVGLEFRRVYDEQNFGMALPEALKGMAQRVPVLDARFFVTAVLTQREAGGNLAEVLDNLSSVMRERFKVRRQIRVVSAHGRITAWVLTMLPLALAGILWVVSPTFMRPLLDDPLGLRLIFAAMTLQIVGTVIIAKMVKVEY